MKKESATYWNGKGRYITLNAMLEKLVPGSGECPDAKGKNRALDRFRRASNCYYDLFNNGLGNRAAEFRALYGFSLRDFKRDGDMDFDAIQRSGIVEEAMDAFILDAAREQGLLDIAGLFAKLAAKDAALRQAKTAIVALGGMRPNATRDSYAKHQAADVDAALAL